MFCLRLMQISESVAPLKENRPPDMPAIKNAPKSMKQSQSTRKRKKESVKKSDTSIPKLTAADFKLYSKFMLPDRRPLNNYDRKIRDINRRAVKAFREKNQELFTKIILETKSLYVRDDAVRLAAEVGWMEVAERLLIRKTASSYMYPVYPAPLTMAFAKLNNDCDIRKPEGRSLLKMAVFSAVMKGSEEAFNLLALIVGIDFADFAGRGVIQHVASSKMDLDMKKKWMHLIVKHIDQNVSNSIVGDAIYYCAELQLVEHLPYLMNCLFFTCKNMTWVMAPLGVAIKDKNEQVVHCIVNELKKASIPISERAMYAAKSNNNVEMVLYLYENGCHSFPLQVYGEGPARDLYNFLLKNNLESIYSSIVIE